MHSPKFVFAGNVPKRLKRYCDFDRVTVSGNHSFGFKHYVQTEIFTHSLSPYAISLNTKGIEIEFVGAPLIVEGVEQYADVIVVPDAVALGNVGANFVGFVEAMKRDVEEARIVAEAYFCFVLGNQIVARLYLVEILEQCCGVPNFIIKLPINDRCLIERTLRRLLFRREMSRRAADFWYLDEGAAKALCGAAVRRRRSFRDGLS